MHSIQLKNIRSLADTGEIEIKPLTFLLWQNSSGKSSLLRSFPLMKQSIRTRANSPLLWYGDYVDFGSIEDVKSTFSGSDPITFKVTLKPGQFATVFTPHEYNPFANVKLAKYAMMIIEKNGRTILEGFSIELDDDVLNIKINEEGVISILSVNDVDFSNLLPKEQLSVTTTEFVPQLVVRNEIGVKSYGFQPGYRRILDFLVREIRKYLASQLHAGMAEKTINGIARRITYAPGGHFFERLRAIETNRVSWMRLVDRLSTNPLESEAKRLRGLALLSSLPYILVSLDRSFLQSMNGVSYVGPARASVERFYRIQELAVDQIDPQGKNLAVFLGSLSLSEQSKFSDWLEETIGYRIEVHKGGGHIRLHLKPRGSEHYHNIIDMGYGFSQILPILAQVWLYQHRKIRFGPFPTVVMEQPELHLHPGYQAKLAEVFVSAIKSLKGDNKPSGLRFIIETHSEALINQVGSMIYKKQLSKDDVAIYVFDKPTNVDKANVRAVYFDSEGTLQNWPIGFFSVIPE